MLTTPPLFRSQSDCLALLPWGSRSDNVHGAAKLAVRHRVRLLLGRWGRRFDGLAARPRPLLLAKQTLRSG